MLPNGNASPGTFTTTTNTVSLVPSSYPPSTVSVVTIHNGVATPNRTKATTLTPFSQTTNATMQAVAFLCTGTTTVSLLNVPIGLTPNWSVTASSVASILSQNNSSLVLQRNGTGNGAITVTASIGNSCSETITLSKTIWVGRPVAFTRAPDPTICTNVFIQPTGYSLPVSPGAVTYNLSSNAPNLFFETAVSHGLNINIMTANPGNYTITLTTTNPCGNSTATIFVTARNCSGAGPLFSVFPNPTTTSLMVENILKRENSTKAFEIQNNSFEIYNMNSELVLKGKLIEATEIDVSKLKQGNYILKIMVNETIETHQIIIK